MQTSSAIKLASDVSLPINEPLGIDIVIKL